jgi:DNA (cytosine-5)-methyltransferase 1
MTELQTRSEDCAVPSQVAPAKNWTAVSLFSGAGGFDLGFELAGGHDVLFSNELKKAPATTFAQNFMHITTPVESTRPRSTDLPLATFGDISAVSFDALSNVEVDVLIGGPPCQDFSVMKAHNREGTDVVRGKLYLHFVRALAELQPSAFVFENVPGLMSANRGKAFELIKHDLANPVYALRSAGDIGVNISKRAYKALPYQILFGEAVDAPRLGVPQTRRRLIVVGVRQDIVNRIGTFQFESSKEWFTYQMNGGSTLFRQFPLSCMEVFEGRPATELQHRYREIMEAYRSLEADMEEHVTATRWAREVEKKWTLDVEKDYLLANGVAPRNLSLFGSDFDRAMQEHEQVLKRLGYCGRPVTTLSPSDGTNRQSKEADSVLERMRRIPPGKNYEFVDGTPWAVEGKKLTLIYRRPFPLQPAPTVVAFGGGGTYAYHYERDRSMLTNRERARLQTFTDEFLFHGNPSEIRPQIGEAVPPFLACRIAEELREILPSA